jgi:hypothetical protein
VVLGVVVVDAVPPPWPVVVVDWVVVEVVDPPSSGFTQCAEKQTSPGSHAPPFVHAQDSLPMVHELLFEDEHAVVHAKPIDRASKPAPTKCLFMGNSCLRPAGRSGPTP